MMAQRSHLIHWQENFSNQKVDFNGFSPASILKITGISEFQYSDCASGKFDS
jgi:hypothetical protein